MTESKQGLNWMNLDNDIITDINKFQHTNAYLQNRYYQARNNPHYNHHDFNNILIGSSSGSSGSGSGGGGGGGCASNNNAGITGNNLSSAATHSGINSLGGGGYFSEYNLDSGLNFIGEPNDNSNKCGYSNMLLSDKCNDKSKSCNFIFGDKYPNMINDYIPNTYGFNKYMSKGYQNEFQQQIPSANNIQSSSNPFSSIPFYLPFIGHSYRRPLPPELIEEEPIYVNPRQYERIIKRRIQKASREIKGDLITNEKNKSKPYKHLSRHLHAKRRIRGKGGRFLSKEEAEKERDLMIHIKDTPKIGGSPSIHKDHLASTSKSSNGDMSQEEAEDQKTNANARNIANSHEKVAQSSEDNNSTNQQ